MIKIVHVITGLSVGGAETMLYKLLSETRNTKFEPSVISLTDVGPVGEKIRSLGVQVRGLGMRTDRPNAFRLVRLVSWLRGEAPDIVQTWMYHADFFGGIATRLSGRAPLAWGLRQSNLDPETSRRTTVWIAKLNARMSGWMPDRIVCCSEASQRVHSELGYRDDKMVVIPNGFDLATYKPDPEARISIRRELGVRDNTRLVGIVARSDPQKDHRTFVQAAGRLNVSLPDVHFVLCGSRVTQKNQDLTQWIREARIADNCHLLGQRSDIPRITAALDLATSSSSYGEGFPNVIGEAMASGVPCAVTDVGDSGLIVGGAGKVVPAKDPCALAEAWRALLELSPSERNTLSAAARDRVTKNFELGQVCSRYASLHEELASGRPEPPLI